MAWTYCDNCEVGMDPPTIRERLTDNYLCENCGERSEFDGYSREEDMAALLDYIEEIESRLRKLEQGE